MSLLSAWSISLDSTFKVGLTAAQNELPNELIIKAVDPKIFLNFIFGQKCDGHSFNFVFRWFLIDVWIWTLRAAL